MSDNIDLLEKPVGTMKILVHLLLNDSTTITTLLKNEKLTQRTTYLALDKLKSEGLIYQEESKGFPLCKNYYLTEKGKLVAHQLIVVGNMLAASSSK